MNKKIISIILLVDKQIFCVSQKFNVCSMFVWFVVQRCQPGHKTGLCVEVTVHALSPSECSYIISQMKREFVFQLQLWDELITFRMKTISILCRYSLSAALWSVNYVIYFALMSIFLSVKYNQTKIHHLLSHLPLQRFEDKHSQTPETRCNTLH